MNADLTARAEMFTADMDWAEEDGRMRKVVYRDLSGAAPRFSALVKYAPGTEQPHHDHLAGEEVLVLEGTLEDDDGVYPAGTFVLMPAGTGHAPRSKDGCTFLVRPGQYPGKDRPRVVVDTNAIDWEAGSFEGLEQKLLYRDEATGEAVRLVRLVAGCEVPDHPHALIEETFLIEGDVLDPRGEFGPGCWTRDPIGSHHWASTKGGAVAYVHTGGE